MRKKILRKRNVLVTASIIAIIGSIVIGPTILLCLGIAPDGYAAPTTPPPRAEPGQDDFTLLSSVQVIPGPGLPEDAVVLTSNNNLDVVRHEGRSYLAWRTAPDHFAGTETRIQVVSSTDGRRWRMEHAVFLHRDLREPRLLSYRGRLFLYFSVFGTHRFDFEPQGVMVSERLADGTWSDDKPVGLPGRVVWRVRVENGNPYLIAYEGGERIYEFLDLGGHRLGGLRVEVYTGEDGRTWHPVGPDGIAAYDGGGSEADLAIAADGTMRAVIRNEAGDGHGYGSLLCTAKAIEDVPWSCVPDARKFDSPYAFAHGNEVYVVARRNVTENGAFDHVPRRLRGIRNQLEYIVRGKRCSLWRFTDDGTRLAFIADLPSRGDTCFPAVVPGDRPDEFEVYDYSSDPNGPEIPWSVGQRRPTRIYRHVIRLAPRGG